MQLFINVLVMVTVLTGAAFDIKTGKVVNPFVFLAMAAGICLNFLHKGLPGLGYGLMGCFLPAAALFILYACSMLGAGDIKLFMAAGAFIGPSGIIFSVIAAFFTGAAFSLTLMIKHGIFFCRLNYLANYLFHTLKNQKIESYYDLKRPKRGETFHFAPCIALGTGLWLLWEYTLGR